MISTLVEEKPAEPVVETGSVSKLSKLISGVKAGIPELDDAEYEEDEIEKRGDALPDREGSGSRSR